MGNAPCELKDLPFRKEAPTRAQFSRQDTRVKLVLHSYDLPYNSMD